MGQRGAGKLPGIDLGLKAGLHGGEIVHVSEDATIALAALLDHVLPQPADQRARRIVECCAEIGKRRPRSRWWRRGDRRIGYYRSHGGIRIRSGMMIMVMIMMMTVLV